MTQRCQVTAGPHTSLLRYQRQYTGVEHANERLSQFRSHPAGRPEQDVCPEQHDGPHDGYGKRVSQSGSVAANEIGLKLIELVRGNSNIGQLAEPGVDPVDGL